jgi:uncharacterized delta-60 repeat protein
MKSRLKTMNNLRAFKLQNCLLKSATLFLPLLFICISLLAQTVDQSFNTQVQTTRELSSGVYSLKVLPNNKILVAGKFNNYNGQFVNNLVRINQNGSLDSTFNTDLDLSQSIIYSIIIQNDEKIVLMGYGFYLNGIRYNSRKIIRLNQNGTFDSTFNSEITQGIEAVKSDISGRIIVSGSLQIVENGINRNKGLVRLNVNGAVDLAFDFYVEDFTLQGDKIIYARGISGGKLVYRLNEDGSNDPSFTVTYLALSSANSILIPLPDGKTFFFANSNLFRLNIDGGIDSSFQNRIFQNPQGFAVNFDGKLTLAIVVNSPNISYRFQRLNFDGSDDLSFTRFELESIYGSLSNVGIQTNGSLIFGTLTGKLIRLQANGNFDSSFNEGINSFKTIEAGKIRTIKELENGKILIGGDFDKVNNVVRPNIALLNADGTLDNSFQFGTQTSGSPFLTAQDIYNFEIQPDGKIIVSGHFKYFSINGSSILVTIVRLNYDGSIDTQFNIPTNINDNFSANSFGPNKIIRSDDGKYLIGTTKRFISDPILTPLKLTSDGLRDNTYNPNFYNLIPTVSIWDIALQTNGKVIVSGWHYTAVLTGPNIVRGFIKRLNSDGSVDSTFEAEELVDKEISAFTILSTEKILTIERNRILPLQSKVSRLNQNGTKDNSFDNGTGANGNINAILTLPNGKTAVGGKFTNYNGQPRQNFAILNEDGSLSSQFISVNGQVFCLSLDSQGRILIGGEFTSLGNQQTVNQAYIARINSFSQTRLPIFDFDGDGKTDISNYRSDTSEWLYLRSLDNANQTFRFGTSTDKIVPADYTGDGKTDIATFTPSTGFWNILRSEDSTFFGFPFGTTGDIAAPADYDGDGKADAAVFRTSNSTWFISKSSGGTTIQQFGASGDKPVVADYDGDGKADLAIYRVALGQWWLVRSSDGGNRAFQFGTSTDKPMQGDYTGDGKTDLAFFRPTTGEWFVLRSEDSTFYGFPFGTLGDIPASGDYDGDGRFDAAVFRPTNTTWYLNRSTSGVGIVGFGANGDQPVPNAFVP